MTHTHENISEIHEKGSYKGVVMLKNLNFPTTTNGSTYLNATLMDKTGTIPGRRWKTKPEDFQFEPGTVMEIVGTIDVYRGEPQIMIENARILAPSDPLSNPMDYLPSAPATLQEMQSEINRFLHEIKELSQDAGLPYYDIAIEILKDKAGSDFYKYPAAKMIHHDFVGGLAYHTMRMLRSAEHVADVYNLDRLLLYTGVLLHDIGKIAELSGIIGTEYTVKGRLLGHIPVLDGWIVETAGKLGFDAENEDITLLRHMLLAHHGTKEFGSPVAPAIPESYALHQIDLMDARLTMFERELDKLESGSLSQRVFGLTDTIYKR